jgi:hypothetical protein
MTMTWLDQGGGHDERAGDRRSRIAPRPSSPDVPAVVGPPRIADIPARQVVARRVARFLRFMRGRVVPAAMLVEYVYGNRGKRSPRHPVRIIGIVARSLCRRGYPIRGVRGGFIWDER